MELLFNVIWVALVVLGVAFVALYFLNRAVDQKTDPKQGLGPE